MASESLPGDRAPSEEVDEGGEPTVSLNDIDQENRERREMEADARAVLGNSDAENCTWDKGYVNRQALYACMTCRPDAKVRLVSELDFFFRVSCIALSKPWTFFVLQSESSRAGVCLACSYSCHDGHELVELYTKRNFRCDCGNGKFEGGRGDGDGKCRLMPHKENRNPDNCYNQNYDGVYCTCSRPYPDPDDTVEDEMIQVREFSGDTFWHVSFEHESKA